MKVESSRWSESGGFFFTAIIHGLFVAVPFALVWAWHSSALEEQPMGKFITSGLNRGLLAGLFFGIMMGFTQKCVTANVSVADTRTFLSRLNVALAQLDYHPATQTEHFFSYRPSFRGGWLGGRISVHLQEGTAVIVGPNSPVKKLLKRLIE
jgi:hypothetical protein